jgi:hypothetical protein
VTLPARGIEFLRDNVRMRRGERDVMTALVGLHGNAAAGAAREDVGEAAHAIDRRLGVARGDKDSHNAGSGGAVSNGHCTLSGDTRGRVPNGLFAD